MAILELAGAIPMSPGGFMISTVGGPPSITTVSPLPAATQSTFYSFSMSAAGGTQPYTWSLTSNTGTNTWSISSSGVVSGTPGNLETDSLVIKVTDASLNSASGTFSLTVNTNSGYTFDFFMAPNGDDVTGNGTLGNPWSITAINSKQSTYAGKKIGVIGDISGVQTSIQFGTANGTQTTLFSLFANSTPILNLNGGPNSSTPTILASCNSSGVYTPQWAIIDVANPSGGAHPTLDSSYVTGQNHDGGGAMPANLGNFTIDGLVLRNFCFAAIGAGYTGLTRQVNNIVIKNCEMYGSNNSSTSNNNGAIRIDNTTGLQVLNCKIHDCASSSGGFPPAYPAVMSYNSTGLVVTNCTFYNIDSVQQKDANQDGIVSYCYLDCGSFGVHSGSSYGSYYEGITGTGRTTTFHHNICLGPFYLSGGTFSNFTGDYEVYNNTFYLTGSQMPIFYWQSSTGTFHTYNNVFYQQSGTWTAGSYGVAKATGASGSLMPTWDYNYYLTGPQFDPTGAGGALVSYASWQGLGFDAHSHTGGNPFASAPSALNMSSFTISGSSAAFTGSNTGGICGAVDGSGSIGCNF